MVAHDLLRNGQAKSSPPLFAITYKGLENERADGFGDARTVVPNSDLYAVLSAHGCHLYPPGIWWNRLASIQNDVRDHLLQTSRVELTLGQTFVIVADHNPPEFRSYRHDPNGALEGAGDVGNLGREGCRVPGGLQKQ